MRRAPALRPAWPATTAVAAAALALSGALAPVLPLAAQAAPPPRRFAVAVGAALGATGDIGVLKTSGCAEGSSALSGALTVRLRALRAMVAEATLSVPASPWSDDMLCLRGRAPAPGDTVFEHRSYRRTGSTDEPGLFLAPALRVGVETPPGVPRWVPLLRATAGVGYVVGQTGFATFAGALGTRGPRLRAIVEVERWAYRLALVDRIETFRVDGGAGTRREERVRVTSRPTFVRVGVELPVGGRR